MSRIYRVTVPEAAERSGFTSLQLLNRIRRKKVRAKKFGWIYLLSEEEVQRLIAEKRLIKKIVR